MRRLEFPTTPEEIAAVQAPCERKMITIRMPEAEIDAFKRFVIDLSAREKISICMNDAYRMAIRAMTGLTVAPGKRKR